MLRNDPNAVADIAAVSNRRSADEVDAAMGGDLDLSRVVGNNPVWVGQHGRF